MKALEEEKRKKTVREQGGTPHHAQTPVLARSHYWRLMVVMVAAGMVAWSRRGRRGVVRDVIVFVVVVEFVILAIQWCVVLSVVASRWRGLIVGVVLGVLVLLARLLPLASLHPGLFKQSTLLGRTLALLPILDLVLPNECERGRAEDVLVLAELADPGRLGRVVVVGVLLLRAATLRSQRVQLRGAAAGPARRGWLLVGRGTLLGRRVLAWQSRVLRAIGMRAGLGALVVHRGVWTDGRACARCGGGGIGTGGLGVVALGAVFLTRPAHLVCRVGAAGKSKLRLVCAVLGGFLLQQTHVFVAGLGRRGLRVGDCGRDDASLVWRS